jgi:hypothetical protein
VAVVGSSLSAEVLQSIDSRGSAGRAAAFTVEPLDGVAGRIRCALVAGHLDPAPARALPGEVELAVRMGTDARVASDPYELLGAVERLARGSGATATWSRRDWVRYEGAHGSIRVFPSDRGAWLQLTGADEGALTGLRFRHGLPLDLGDPSGGPPGAHLYLRDRAALTAPIEALIRQWLRGVV